jgi:hypothetical protein
VATTPPNAVRRPAGLPLPATAPLSAAEREILLRLARLHRAAVDEIADALHSNRVTDALQALEISAEVGRLVDDARPKLGAGR